MYLKNDTELIIEISTRTSLRRFWEFLRKFNRFCSYIEAGDYYDELCRWCLRDYELGSPVSYELLKRHSGFPCYGNINPQKQIHYQEVVFLLDYFFVSSLWKKSYNAVSGIEFVFAEHHVLVLNNSSSWGYFF